MPQAIAISNPHGRVDTETGEIIPGERVNYNNYPGLVGDYTVGVSETFAGADPSNINFNFSFTIHSTTINSFTL